MSTAVAEFELLGGRNSLVKRLLDGQSSFAKKKIEDQNMKGG
jgi:hypothetical protein